MNTGFNPPVAPPPSNRCGTIHQGAYPSVAGLVTIDPNGLLACSCTRFLYRLNCNHVEARVAQIRSESNEDGLWNCRCGQVEISQGSVSPVCPDCHIPMSDSWLMTETDWQMFQADLAYDEQAMREVCESEEDEEIRLSHRSFTKRFTPRERAANTENMQWDDSDPFADEPAEPVVLARRPASYYEGLAL